MEHVNRVKTASIPVPVYKEAVYKQQKLLNFLLSKEINGFIQITENKQFFLAVVLS